MRTLDWNGLARRRTGQVGICRAAPTAAGRPVRRRAGGRGGRGRAVRGRRGSFSAASLVPRLPLGRHGEVGPYLKASQPEASHPVPAFTLAARRLTWEEALQVVLPRWRCRGTCAGARTGTSARGPQRPSFPLRGPRCSAASATCRAAGGGPAPATSAWPCKGPASPFTGHASFSED